MPSNWHKLSQPWVPKPNYSCARLIGCFLSHTHTHAHTHRQCDLGLRSICWICCIWRDSNARQSFQLLLIIAMGRQMSLVQGTHNTKAANTLLLPATMLCLSGATGRVASGNGRIATCCTFSACLAYFSNHSRDRDSSYRCTRSGDINSKFLPIALHATIFNDMLQFLSFPGFDFVCRAVCRHVQHVAVGFQWLFLFASCLINCLAKAKR